ncbi:BMP family protein [Paraburkholderia xenovorans]|uniref:BMP family protein n=1 Tax=Paraburkholderia xenovorans TaxID=36873 RepID=UPI0038BD3932
MSDAQAYRRRLLAGLAAAAALPLIGKNAFASSPKIKVAGVHSDPVANAWNARLHEALQQAAKAGRIDYVFSESVSNTDYPRVLREYANQGAQLIVGESYGTERDSRAVARDYPKVGFLMGSSSGPAGDNFGVFGTWNHEAAYLTGILAGHMTKTGKLGAVGGYPIPEVNRLINAYRLGASEAKPGLVFQSGFINTWFDPPKAKEAALAQIDSGCDILFGERIGTADGAKMRGKLAIGSLMDYMPRYPGTVYSNASWYFDPILEAALADLAAGKPVGRDYSPYSMMARGGNDITFDRSLVPAAALAQMEARRTAIKSGAFKVPVNDAKPA